MHDGWSNSLIKISRLWSAPVRSTHECDDAHKNVLVNSSYDNPGYIDVDDNDYEHTVQCDTEDECYYVS